MVVDNEETRLCDDNEGEILTLIGWWWPGWLERKKGDSNHILYRSPSDGGSKNSHSSAYN